MAKTHTKTGRPPRGTSGGRGAAVTLLAASLATLAMLVIAMVRENVTAPWRVYQKQYYQRLSALDDPTQKKLAAAFEVKLRQVDLPALGTTDRCVTCHLGMDNPAMADAPQPFRTHSGDYLAKHPTAQYGCTVCHHGQGYATNFHDAKAVDAHWDYPLLPTRLTEASCGRCHAPDSELMRREAPRLALGRALFVDRGCQGCHRLDAVGGSAGPALDGLGLKNKHLLTMTHVQGARTRANWLAQHFADPQAVIPKSKMPPPRLYKEQLEALTIYMLSLQRSDLPRSYIPPDAVAAWSRRLHQPILDGEPLYDRYCVTCHGEGSYGRWNPFFHRFMPAVRGPGLTAVADREYLRRATADGRPGTLMPAWDKSAGGLSDKQIDAIVSHLQGPGDRPRQPLRETDTPIPTGRSEMGKAIFVRHCSGCHGREGRGGLGPALANPGFQRIASDRMLYLTIVNGRADTAMPAFHGPSGEGLTRQDLGHLLAYIRTWAPPAAEVAPAEADTTESHARGQD